MNRSIQLGATLAATLCFSSAGCELGNTLGDVAGELSNPELEAVETGGRLIQRGHHVNIQFDGTSEDGAFVVGLRDGQTLSIAPFSGTGGCEAGEARRYRSALRRGDDRPKLDARIPFQTRATDEEPGELRFTNFACEVDELVLQNGSLPLSTSFAAEPGFISQDGGGDVYYLNPWNNERKKLASAALRINRTDRVLFAPGKAGAPWMWMVSGGQVLAYDSTLKQQYLGRADVTDLAHSAGGAGGPMVATLTQTGELATAFTSDLSNWTAVDQNACGMSFNAGKHGRELVYFSPCGERRLIVQELETKTRRDFGPQPGNFRIIGATNDGPSLLFLVDPDPGNPRVGELWVRLGETPPIRLGKKGHLDLTQVNGAKQVVAVLNWSGQSGELRVGQLGEPLEKVASGVAHLSALGLISDFDGQNGKLQRLDPETGKLEPLAKNASIHGIRVDNLTERGLFLTSFDGEKGDLTLLQGTQVRVIADDVRPGQYQFTALLPMITVLTSLDSALGTATLELHHLDRDQTIKVSEGVSEVVEVSWPREGILYSVPLGDRSGVWFAQAQ
jgi:hypothetical protein